MASAAGAALLPGGCATTNAIMGATTTTARERIFPVVPEARALSALEWAVLAALQELLLPSAPGSPGARDVDAITFLDGVLARGEVPPRVAARIRAGVVDLEAIAHARGAPSFVDLDDEGRAAAVGSLTLRYKGRRFLRYVLEHTLEAFLGDPVHGGNPEEIAWRYLGHRAGYPRPPPSSQEGA